MLYKHPMCNITSVPTTGGRSISLKEIEPDYKSLWDYTNLLLSVLYPEDFPKTLDEDKLTEVYGKLNNYLHAIKDHATTIELNRWWADILQAFSLQIYLFVRLDSLT